MAMVKVLMRVHLIRKLVISMAYRILIQELDNKGTDEFL